MANPNYKTTSDIKIPEKLIDQVIGQKKAVDIIKKAATQRRNVLLIGEPGTGKTMLAQAMAELLPSAELEDILIYKNVNDENAPSVKAVKTYPNYKPGEKLGDGQGRQILQKERAKNRMALNKGNSWVAPVVMALVIIIFAISLSGYIKGYEIIVLGALILGIMIFGSMLLFMSGLMRRVGLPGMNAVDEPKLIVDNTGMTHAPFLDATGSKAGALFGDVRHDPLQCIPNGEIVLLDSGNPVPIESIVNRFFGENQEGVIDVDDPSLKVMGGGDDDFWFFPARVTRVYKRKYVGKLITIKTRGGSQIRVTPNHPIAFLNDDGIVGYRLAAEVLAGQRAIIPERLEVYKSTSVPINLVEFLADALADGYIGARHVEFNLKMQFKINCIIEDIKKLGFEPKIRIRAWDGATQISVNSAALCKLLLDMGAKEGKMKLVPDDLFREDRSVVTAFVSRMLSLDGYINKQGQFEIVSSNKRFIQQFRALLFTLGVNASYKTQPDNGYGKEQGRIQQVLRWSDYGFAKEYYKLTINPNHIRNMDIYFAKHSFNKEAHYDVIPVKFETLDQIRLQLGASKEKVYQDYWSINPSVEQHTNLTRNLLQKVTERLVSLGATGTVVSQLHRLSTHAYAFDEIIEVGFEDYDGFVYNLTTSTSNYMVDFVLTHNSGGLGTPAHLRVESGAIHKANKGVLYIDEVSSLEPRSQQELLTSLQEKKYSITGQSEMSSGALVKTEPVPSDFILVAAGNLQDLQHMHPALRSRIRGYGYEVYMDSTMDDTPANQQLVVQFVAQEVKKDEKIPPFDKGAVEEIIEEARRRAGRKKKLTLILRDLGGLVRAAGDIAIDKHKKLVTKEDVIAAKSLAGSIESQIVTQELEFRKDYRVFNVKGFGVGKVNGLAVIGTRTTNAGIVIPIVAEVTPAGSKSEGKFIPTGKLGKIASEAVKNVSAIIKKHMGKDITNYDMHVQFLQIEGVEGDSASISVAVSIISAMENIPVKQSVAMTGSLSVRGEVLPVGGVTSKVEAAIAAGEEAVILPATNLDDVALNKEKLKKIKLIPVKTLADVLKYALKDSKRKDEIIRELRRYEKDGGKAGKE